MPLDVAQARTGAGISNDEELEWSRKIRRAKRVLDEAQGVYRSILKQAKSDGVITEKMIAALKATRKEPEDVATELAVEIHYLNLLGVSAVTPERLFARDARITTKTQAEEDHFDAEEAGYKAGKRSDSIDSNPYEPGTEMFGVWRENWHAGQAANAAEMAPGERIASGAMEHPGRKGAAAAAAPTKAAAKKAAPAKKPAGARKAPAKKAAAPAADTPQVH